MTPPASRCRNGHELALVGFAWRTDGKGNRYRRCLACQRDASERQTRKAGALPRAEAREWCRRRLHRLEGENVRIDPRTGSRLCRACAGTKAKKRWQATQSDKHLLAQKKKRDRTTYLQNQPARRETSRKAYEQVKLDPERLAARRARERRYREEVLKPARKDSAYSARYRAKLAASTSPEAAEVKARARARSQAAARRVQYAGRREIARLQHEGLRLRGWNRLERQRLTNLLGRLALRNGTVSREHFDPELFTSRGRLRIFIRDGFKCWHCSRRVTEATGELDHIKPVAKGGLHFADNLRTSCRPCNARKHAKFDG